MQQKSNNNQRVNKFYVYGHYTNDNKLFYIGVGTILYPNSKTHKQIYSRAYHFSNRNKYWKNISNKYGVVVKILSEFYTKEESLKEEEKLVELYGRRILKTGNLCNISSGGEIGPIGRIFKMSLKQRQLLSDLKSTTLYIYNKQGIYLTSMKTIKNTAKYCGVTYNAIHTCINANNLCNNYFIFKDYQDKQLSIEILNKNRRHTNSKIVISEDIYGNKLEHANISDCAKYLKCTRESVRDCLKRSEKSRCKKHKIYLKDNQQPRP